MIRARRPAVHYCAPARLMALLQLLHFAKHHFFVVRRTLPPDRDCCEGAGSPSPAMIHLSRGFVHFPCYLLE